MKNNIIIIPTYNERGNIAELIQKIFILSPDVHIMIIDDNSPDKTASVVEALQKNYKNLSLVLRNKKNGLGSAYIEGFKKVLRDDTYKTVTMMDGDLSHNPKHLPEMLILSSDYDIIIGSRYIKGGGVTKKWNLLRRILSSGANIYLRIIFRYPVRDWTTGYNTIRTDTLRKINLDTLNMSGYAFISSLKYFLLHAGVSYKEIPILFEERFNGKSKMSLSIIIEGVVAPWKIIFRR